MVRSIMAVLLLTVFVILSTQTHAGIIFGFEPVWEEEATLGTPVSAGTFRDTITGMELVTVKGGCFQMGDTFGDGQSDEKPVHKVCVSDFRMGKYEVTQGQWPKVMGNNPSYFSTCGGECPVENVSWNDAQEYIQKLNERRSGSATRPYRLPTEAEWEYATRSGGKTERVCNPTHKDYLVAPTASIAAAVGTLLRRTSGPPIAAATYQAIATAILVSGLWPQFSEQTGKPPLTPALSL